MYKKRILIFNVNWLGDVLFSTPTIRNIRRNFPGSFIACIVPSRCYPILKGNPHLNEVIIYDEKDRHKGIISKLSFVKMLKVRRFDTVFLLHRSFSRALICRLAGIKQRIGYYSKKRGFLMTQKILAPKKDSLHRIDYYLDLAEKAGLKIEDRYLEFFIDEEDARVVEEFLRSNSVSPGDILVALNPGGNWLPKRWPVEYWAELAGKLIAEFKAKVVITGNQNDAFLARRINELMKEKPLISAGVFNLKQMGALCRRADLFISADSGPLHIANALGTKKIIALFGPTSLEITGPFPLKNISFLQKNVGCIIPCYKVKCKDNRCMKAILPDEVFVQAKSIIAGLRRQ